MSLDPPPNHGMSQPDSEGDESREFEVPLPEESLRVAESPADRRLRIFLRPFKTLPSLRFARVLDTEGNILRNLGQTHAAMAPDLQRLHELASDAARATEQGLLSQMILECEHGVVILKPLAEGQLFVLCLNDIGCMGKALLMLRQI